MESAENKNCGHCNNPGAVKKCCKSHSRCKEVRFCNKHCEKDAHVKKPNERQPEDPKEYAKKLLKQEIEAEMKRKAKVERRTNRLVSYTKYNNCLKWLEAEKKK